MTPERAADWRRAAAAALAALLFFACANVFIAVPDTASYWSWAQSIARELDLDFANQFEEHRFRVRLMYLTPADRIANDWPIGTGLLLLPAVALGPLAAHAWIAFLGIAALALAARAAQAPPAAALAFLAGTPLLFYLLFGAFFSHIPAFALSTAFLLLWWKTAEERAVHEWLLLGLLLGACACVRPQLALLGLVFAADAPAWIRARSAPARGLAVAAMGALGGFAPQLLAWRLLYGKWLALPKSEEMRWSAPELWNVVFSDYHGVATWTPLTLLGAAGLAALWRADRRAAAGFGLVLAAQLYINAANMVWWGSGSFGQRRLVDISAILLVGLGALWSVAAGRPRARFLLGGTALLCCAWTLLLLAAERRGLVLLDRYIPMRGPEFRSHLAATAGQPLDTARALAAPLLRGEFPAARAASAIALGAAVGGLLWRLPRMSRGALRPLAGCALAAAVGASALVAAAGLRTPPVDDPEAAAQLGRTPRTVWENHLEYAHYQLNQYEFAEAERTARAAIAMFPQGGAPWWYLAASLYLQDRFEESRAALLELFAREPHHALGARLAADLGARGFPVEAPPAPREAIAP
ncbi:MAG: hypothetical protein SF028_10095 [Candidatus Sumerlaeia bacterium]|nr:hypothetical protein [Candidatus Sumerlaeia bacterium]